MVGVSLIGVLENGLCNHEFSPKTNVTKMMVQMDLWEDANLNEPVSLYGHLGSWYPLQRLPSPCWP